MKKYTNINITMKRMCRTGLIIIVICVVWMLMELILYGEIQERMVDNIMMIVFIPFIYRSTGVINS